MRTLRLALPILALLVAGPVRAAHAGDEPDGGPAASPKPDSQLTVDRVFGGGPPIVRGGPSIASWRPGREAGKETWVEWRSIDEKGEHGARERALFEIEAATGDAKPLVRLSEVVALRRKGEPACATRGIGRAGMPDHVWARDGEALVMPVDGDLALVDLHDAARPQFRRLTRTKASIADVRPSPDATKVAFSRESDLHVAFAGADSAAGGAEGRTTERRLTDGGSDDLLNATLDWVYPEELDATTAIQWSPDSTRIAFLRLDEKDVPRVAIGDPIPLHGDVFSERYPKAGDKNPVPRVGVVDAGAPGSIGDTPTWLDLGADPDVYIPWFVWWPDGSRVLVAVLSRAQTHLELRLCDPTGKASTTWWTEDDARWVDVPPAPKFLRSQPAALLRSRRDGFWRLYRVALDGGDRSATPLTPAKREIGEVLAVDETPDRMPVASSGESAAGPSEPRPTTGSESAAVKYAAYVAMEDRATLRSQVVRVPLDGHGVAEGGVTTVTDPAFSHSARFSPSATLFVDAASRAGVPTRWTLRRADGTEVRALADARSPAWDALRLRPPEIRVLAGDPEMPCVIRTPRRFDPSKKWPVVFHVYGGPGSRMVSDSFGGGGLFDEVLAESGLVVISVDGRGTNGRGKDFEATVYRRLGTCEVEDLVTAVDRLAKEPWFDRERVGIWGWSYGGTFAAYAMGKAPQVFRAGVAVAPVTDWRLYDTIYTERYMDRPSENEEGYRIAAATTWAKDVSGSLLLAHGLADDNVHAQNTWRMVQALVAAGRPFDLQVYPQRGHGIEGAEDRRHLHRRIVEHFRAHLVEGGK